MGNMMARYFWAMDWVATGAVGAAGEELAGMKAMGFFQRPRPYAGWDVKGRVEMSASL